MNTKFKLCTLGLLSALLAVTSGCDSIVTLAVPSDFLAIPKPVPVVRISQPPVIWISAPERIRIAEVSPRIAAIIQHNDTVYQQQQSAPVTAPGESSGPQAQAPASETPTPLSAEEIKTMAAIGLKKDAIIDTIQKSKSTYSPQDIAMVQNATPPIDSTIIECMKTMGTK